MDGSMRCMVAIEDDMSKAVIGVRPIPDAMLVRVEYDGETVRLTDSLGRTHATGIGREAAERLMAVGMVVVGELEKGAAAFRSEYLVERVDLRPRGFRFPHGTPRPSEVRVVPKGESRDWDEEVESMNGVGNPEMAEAVRRLGDEPQG